MYAHVESCKNNNQPQQVYCKKHNLAYSTFQYWAKKYRKEHSGNDTVETFSGFIPVKVQPDSRVNQAHTSNQLHFLMPNGVQVLCPETIQPQVLKTLLDS